jgi:hypothetical protein
MDGVSTKELAILMLEDVATDAELIERVLCKAGLQFRAMRVDTRESFTRALDEFRPDIVLSDYKDEVRTTIGMVLVRSSALAFRSTSSPSTLGRRRSRSTTLGLLFGSRRAKEPV